jgi:hypothetical protein
MGPGHRQNGGRRQCTCALGTQNPTTHDVADEIRPNKLTSIPAARGNPDGGVKMSREHTRSPWMGHGWSSRRPTLPRHWLTPGGHHGVPGPTKMTPEIEEKAQAQASTYDLHTHTAGGLESACLGGLDRF